MPKFEVLIPKTDKLPMDLRLRLEAESWIEALRVGLAKAGIGGMETESILCDIHEDNSIHVTDTRGGRVFRILELPEEPDPSPAPRAGTAARPQPVTASGPTIPQMAAVQRPDDIRAKAREQEHLLQPATEPEMPAARPEPVPAPAKPAPAPVKPAPAPVKPAPAPVKPAPAPVKPAPAPEAVTTPSTSRVIGRHLVITSEATADMLEEVFEITGQLGPGADRQKALYRMLDLAMEKVGTDAGTVFIADINKNELDFGAVRGPKAREVVKFKIKMGQGIVGFCCQANLGLAVSDATRDPRFYREVSERLGYPTRSILCVPLRVEERVVGALELINKKSTDTFSERDLGIANFIAQHLARYLAQ